MDEASSRALVARAFGDIASVLRVGDASFEELARRIAEAAVRVVDGCDHAAVSGLDHGRFRTIGASSDIARRLDELQAETGEGPCVDAVTDEGWEHTVDLADIDEPDEFQRRMREETPVRSMLGFRLVEDGDKRGALNLASERAHGFGDAAAEEAAVLAAFASATLTAAAARQRAEELREAMDSAAGS